jgi:hypothetical protein
MRQMGRVECMGIIKGTCRVLVEKVLREEITWK